MTTDSSIKWRLIWKIWIPLILFFIPLILETLLFGTYFTPYIYGLLVLIYGIVYYLRTKLWQAIVLMSFMSITIWTYFLAARPYETFETFQLIGIDPGANMLPWLKTYLSVQIWFFIMVINGVIFYTLGPRLLRALALEKNAIKLFRLSARDVFDEGNGFTERPYNAGKHPYTRNELFGFTSFLETKNICVAEFYKKGIRFMFSMGTSPLCKKHRDRITYIMFEDNGDLSVFISAGDYKQYRKQYTFDQLCEMMGKTFLRFAEYYNSNNEQRIITELKSV